ncbi:hypothetical protein GCM10027605_38140 [Micromonospora zhanjiangensis]
MTTTPQAVRRPSPPGPEATAAGPESTTTAPADRVAALLPHAEPVRLLDESGRRVPGPAEYAEPSPETLRELYRRMVVGRRFDLQSTALTKQGRLAVYPSARGQEACQVAGVMAVRDTDWVFPTYRESMALVARGIDPVEVLTLLRGDWHCGYDSAARRTAPQCTPSRPRPCTPPGSPTARRTRAGTPSRWRSSATAPPARATSTRGQLRRRVPGTGGVLRAEQPVRHQRAAVPADGGAGPVVQGCRLRHRQ